MRGTIVYRDWFGKNGSRSYEFVSADYTVAFPQLVTIAGLLQQISHVEVTEVSMKIAQVITGVPSPYGVSTADNAVVTVGTVGGGKASLFVPAPKEPLLVPGSGALDVNDADLQSYVAQIAAVCTVSDGETIDTAVGVGGVLNGHWTSLAKTA